MNLNRATIIGRLTRDPETKALPSGMPVTNFSVATSSTYVKDGEKVEETEFHNIVVFAKQADACATFLRKGTLVAIEGRLQTRSWEKDGAKHYRTEIIADRVQFGPKNERSADAQNDVPPPPTLDGTYPQEDIDPNEIPF
ncbi:single-stranded DNA-binding protein [Palleronia sp. KMU-117]|uniref:single-stranded DNA-binding protein n=1 Tax=Palleronia sp. KMU-117 TaxID=3434108 RepID=UPI003D731C47